MKIILTNKEYLKEKFVKNWGEFACQCYDTPIEKAVGVGKHCLKSNHTSGSRTEYFKFNISGISRSCSLQLNRHSQGVVINQQSQRYVNMNNVDFVVPKIIQDNTIAFKAMEVAIEESKKAYNIIQEELIKSGYTKEQANENARMVLLESCHTQGMWAFSLEAIVNFMHKRLCVRAQTEIRELANLMRKEIIKVLPELDMYLVPSCEYLLWCPELKSCGRKPTKDKLLKELGNEKD